MCCENNPNLIKFGSEKIEKMQQKCKTRWMMEMKSLHVVVECTACAWAYDENSS